MRFEHSNFWVTCPKKLEYFPKVECLIGKNHECEWHVRSEEDNYCFWKWVRRVSDEKGCFERLHQREMIDLLGYSNNKIHILLKEGLKNLEKTEEFELLREFFLTD